MHNTEPSEHAKDMLRERNIPEEWMWRAIDIPEHGGRFLRVIVNHHVTPKRVVTLFFDRRLGRQE